MALAYHGGRSLFFRKSAFRSGLPRLIFFSLQHLLSRSFFSFQSVEISKCERHLITSDLRVPEPCLNPGPGILRAIVILSLSHLGVTRARMNLRSKVLRFLLFAFQSFCVEYYLPEMVGRKFDGLNNKRIGLKNILPSTKSFPESF